MIVRSISKNLVGEQSTISVDVDGYPLWFSTADTQLVPTATGIANCLWLSAQYHGRSVQLDQPVCPLWHRNAMNASETVRRWWRFPKVKTELDPVGDEFRTRSTCTQANRQTELSTTLRARRGTGLLFTGGVDSFFSLLQYPKPIDFLIYIADFDVPPQAETRISGFEAHLRTLCKERQIQPLVIRSNLRQHPAFQGPSWQQSHGAALIGSCHLLTETIDELVVSSSYSQHHPRAWGSHWELDPLWSSSQLHVVHFGDQFRRFDKLAKVVADDHVQRFLRPCWENPNGRMNCTVCEKCIRTQICIASCGELKRFQVFDQKDSLEERIRGLKKISNPDLLEIYEDFLKIDLEPEVLESIAQLISRSRFSAFRKRVRSNLRDLMSLRGARRSA